MNAALKAKLKTLPAAPGVYFHKDKTGEVIYVGKAAVLKNRVRSYFNREHPDAKTRALVAEIVDTDWIETDSEVDALFLESEMIKRYMPRWNILLRDDKSQMFVRINLKDPIPFISFTRRPLDDRAEYYGPFYNGAAVKKALRFLRRTFPYYVNDRANENQLDYQLGLTPGVKLAAAKLNQDKLSHPENLPTDEAEFAARDKTYRANLSKLIQYVKGNRKKVQREIENEMKTAAKTQDFEAAAHFRNQLNDLRELQRQILFGREEFMDISKDQALVGLKDLLNLPDLPRRIEGYDISHISGTNNVASMVVFTNGVADKNNYRKFKIQHARGGDDTASLRETITRRLKHLRDWGRPDLVLLDGGIGQIHAVEDLLDAEKIPYVGRNKSGQHSGNARTVLVIPRDNDFQEIPLANDSHIAKLIARIDDEAHRFAISYHTALRKKGQIKNELEEIPGIGPTTRKKLLRRFGSVAGVKQASESAIADVIGVAKAKIVAQHLRFSQ
jgi:excinuclease ABC subunit C